MEAIKIIKKIRSKNLHIDELEKYIGQEAEIIILPLQSGKLSSVKEIMKLAGSLPPSGHPLEFQKKMRNEWKDRL
ncbi:MAG: hypothetical protein P8184_19665 [Calditrichia bacterium]